MDKKKAIVTGGSKGIGLAIIEQLVEDGYFVWYFSRTKMIKDIPNTKHIECDLSNFVNFENKLKLCLNEMENIDLLVNNAGITKDGLAMRMSLNDFTQVIDINLTSSFIACKTVSRLLLRQKKGNIINISSVVGIVGNSGQANYSSSKAGLIGLTKSLAKEFSSKNIRVNAVAPGFIKTDMTDKLNETQIKHIEEAIPLKVLGQPKDVANLVSFLASERASYITGQVINVDGGMVI